MLIRFRHPPNFGRLGNQMFWYYRVRSYCEQNEIDFEVEPWLGEKVFESVSHPITSKIPDLEWNNSTLDVQPNRNQAREWFKLKFEMQSFPLVLHLRRGDYVEANSFHLIGLESYRLACIIHQIPWEPVVVSDDVPFQFWRPETCQRSDSFALDFSVMVNAKRLFIGNSSFSRWAAFLGNGQSFEPCNMKVEGKTATCDFQKWP